MALGADVFHRANRPVVARRAVRHRHVCAGPGGAGVRSAGQPVVAVLSVLAARTHGVEVSAAVAGLGTSRIACAACARHLLAAHAEARRRLHTGDDGHVIDSPARGGVLGRVDAVEAKAEPHFLARPLTHREVDLQPGLLADAVVLLDRLHDLHEAIPADLDEPFVVAVARLHVGVAPEAQLHVVRCGQRDLNGRRSPLGRPEGDGVVLAAVEVECAAAGLRCRRRGRRVDVPSDCGFFGVGRKRPILRGARHHVGPHRLHTAAILAPRTGASSALLAACAGVAVVASGAVTERLVNTGPGLGIAAVRGARLAVAAGFEIAAA